MVIIRVARDQFRLLWCCICFITHIRGRKIRPKVVYTAGTIRTCQREVVNIIRVWAMDCKNVLENNRKGIQAQEMIFDVNSIVP